MEEKSVEIPKIKGPLREQDSIRALLELLEQQGMEQEKGDVIRMADHIDSMEMQLGTVLKELMSIQVRSIRKGVLNSWPKKSGARLF